MPRHTFRYTEVPIAATGPCPSGHVAFRPYMLALVHGSKGKRIRCIVWPDSGADHCVFPLTFALALGLDPLKMKTQLTGGVGSVANVTYYDTVEIDVGVEAPFTALAGFTAGLEAQGIGLLGQAGFFENFQVTFDLKTRVFHVDA